MHAQMQKRASQVGGQRSKQRIRRSSAHARWLSQLAGHYAAETDVEQRIEMLKMISDEDAIEFSRELFHYGGTTLQTSFLSRQVFMPFMPACSGPSRASYYRVAF